MSIISFLSTLCIYLSMYFQHKLNKKLKKKYPVLRLFLFKTAYFLCIIRNFDIKQFLNFSKS